MPIYPIRSTKRNIYSPVEIEIAIAIIPTITAHIVKDP